MSRSLSASKSGAPSPACHVQHAAQPLVVRAGLPDRAELPAQRAADRFERRRVDLDRSFGFREDLRDFVLDALQDLRVNDH